MKNIAGRILNVICIAIIILAIGILFSVVTTPAGRTPQVLGYSGFRVLTGSMEPEIPANSFVLVKLCKASSIKEGDVISFYSSDASLGGAINTHRVMSIGSDAGHVTFTTKGDANPIADKNLVYDVDLIGKVVFVSHLFGLFIRLISNPIVFAAFIVVPLVIIIFANVRSMAKDIKALVQAEEDPADDDGGKDE